jgi:hypothetical protein
MPSTAIQLAARSFIFMALAVRGWIALLVRMCFES